MCGIFGIASPEIDLNLAKESLHTLSHRGPDQSNSLQIKNVFIGHQRLSILDLSESGMQPMHSNGVYITVNGEIYNFVEIREELSCKYKFVSASDSEVVLHGYNEWGIEKLLSKIDGMYAISIYDSNSEKIYLIRDRLGIKPLFYCSLNATLSWASELKAIDKYFDGKLSIDNTALYDYLTYLYIPAPKTKFNEVKKLEPGNYLEFSTITGSQLIKTYWDLNPVENKNLSLEQAAKEIRRLVDKSVAEQMISDVPVGFFLSGGVDSSSVVCSAKNNSNNISTFSIGFKNTASDETEYAEEVAKLFDTKHHVALLSESDVVGMKQCFLDWYDEPFADTSAFPSFLVSRYAKNNVTVALTGDGGDEIFAGYHWYDIFMRIRHKKMSGSLPCLKKFLFPLYLSDNQIISRVANFVLRNYAYNDFELHTKLLGGLLKEEKGMYARKYGIECNYDDYWYFRKHYNCHLPLLSRLQYLDLKTYLPDDILTKVDRVSMAVSLECRVPLLSKEIVEFSFTIPDSLKVKNGQLKYVLKTAYKDDLPDSVLYRKKKGFSIPVADWKSKLFPGYKTKQQAILNWFETEGKL
ncbi:asparagine synthase (glutamine-hydrolyzing) [Shewanella xiamenensis]|uniref:asparagine synthase (glutamine-hydrolyzing) n=1 Tax=Shewanella xiamenensis TaxID=332186 RepID=UPI0035B8C422